MPFDFINYKHYSINYSELFDEINSKPIFNSKIIQNQYLKLWRDQLEKCDKIVTEELNTKKSIVDLSTKLQSEPEVFQLPIYFKNNEILLHFRASIANQIVDKSKSQAIPLIEFTKKDSVFYWTPTNKNLNPSEEPIIIVPYLYGQYNFLVIDGNHRLTYKVNNNIDKVNTIIFAEQSVISACLFSSGFDKFFYIMINELNHMTNETHYKNADALQLVQKSFLKDGIFKFV